MLQLVVLFIHDVAGRGCFNTTSSAPEDGQNNYSKHSELTGIINKPLLLYLVGYPYYLYFIVYFFLRLAKQSQFIPLQNVVYIITEFLRFQATGRQDRGCIIPQTVTHSLVLLKMGGIKARNVLR